MCLLSKAIDTGLSRWEFPHWMHPFNQSGDCWYAERALPARISERAHHILLHSQIFNTKNMKKRSETGSAAGGYLEPVSGTQQRTLHSRSSRTLRLDSGADTRPHFPARAGRREGTGSRSDIDLLTGRLGIFPGTETRRHSALSGTNNPQRQNSASPSPCTCPHTCPQTCFG